MYFLSLQGYDSAYCFAPALSCIVPAEAQRYTLPYALPPTSCVINSSRQCESLKKKEVQQPIIPGKLIAATTPQATSCTFLHHFK